MSEWVHEWESSMFPHNSVASPRHDALALVSEPRPHGESPTLTKWHCPGMRSGGQLRWGWAEGPGGSRLSDGLSLFPKPLWTPSVAQRSPVRVGTGRGTSLIVESSSESPGSPGEGVALTLVPGDTPLPPGHVERPAMRCCPRVFPEAMTLGGEW